MGGYRSPSSSLFGFLEHGLTNASSNLSPTSSRGTKPEFSPLPTRSPPAQRHRPINSNGVSKSRVTQGRQIKKTDTEWANIYPYLQRLYPVMKLEDVIEKLASNRKFIANQRQYTYRFKSHIMLPKYCDPTTHFKQLEHATNPHFIPEFKQDLSLLLVSELFLAFGHPATESLLRKIIQPHLVPQSNGLIPLTGYGLPIRHIATEACFASAFAVSSGRRQREKMSLWREIATCVPDAQFGMLETTASLFQDFSDFGYEAITGRPNGETVNFKAPLKTEKTWELKEGFGIFDVPAYALWGSNYRSRKTEMSSTGLSVEDDKIATSMYALFQMQPLVRSERCDAHANLFIDILHWMVFVLQTYRIKTEDGGVWKLPANIKSWLAPTQDTACTPYDQKMAVYLVFWVYLYREYTVTFPNSSPFSQPFKSKSPSPNSRRSSSQSSEASDNNDAASPWFLSSFYHVGIPPSLLLRLIISTLWSEDDCKYLDPIGHFHSKLTSDTLKKLLDSPHLTDELMRDVTDIWEGVIDEAAKVIAPSPTSKAHSNSRVWGELEELLVTVVPPPVMEDVTNAGISVTMDLP